MGEAPEMTTARDAAGFRDPATGELRQETMIINMGPQHPSTHGVLRLVLELDGETVIHCKPVIGYLHTGIEKNTEYRTWMQGVTYVTRADYLSPFFNELAYCLGVERLLGVEPPERATLIRILVCELNRITSHLVWLATSGLELGAVSVMLYGFREREVIMEIFEAITRALEQGDVRGTHAGDVREQRAAHGPAAGIELAHTARDEVNQNVGVANLLQCFFAKFRVQYLTLSSFDKPDKLLSRRERTQ